MKSPSAHTHGEQQSGGGLRLLEVAACLTATGYGPQASFSPIGHYLLDRLKASTLLLAAADPVAKSLDIIAAVPAGVCRGLIGQRFHLPEWLSAALEQSHPVIHSPNRGDDQLARLLRDFGVAVAAAAPVPDSGDEPLLIIAGFHDQVDDERIEQLQDLVNAMAAGVRVSSQDRGQYAVASAAATAEQMAAVTQLAATLAHDLNNALAAILGQAELLLEELKGDPRAERVRRISGRTIQLMTLARALEEYANAQLVGQVEDADLGDLARQAVEATRCVWEAEARARHCSIDMICEVEDPTPIRVIPSQVKRSLVHLIFNAIQAIGDRDGTIRVRVWRDGNYAACSVTDDGVGMPEDVLRRCREPFFTTRPGVCQGLGLSLAEATARRHGGDLEITSSPGQGTTVTMYLPLQLTSPNAQSQ